MRYEIRGGGRNDQKWTSLAACWEASSQALKGGRRGREGPLSGHVPLIEPSSEHRGCHQYSAADHGKSGKKALTQAPKGPKIPSNPPECFGHELILFNLEVNWIYRIWIQQEMKCSFLENNWLVMLEDSSLTPPLSPFPFFNLLPMSTCRSGITVNSLAYGRFKLKFYC